MVSKREELNGQIFTRFSEFIDIKINLKNYEVMFKSLEAVYKSEVESFKDLLPPCIKLIRCFLTYS